MDPYHQLFRRLSEREINDNSFARETEKTAVQLHNGCYRKLEGEWEVIFMLVFTYTFNSEDLRDILFKNTHIPFPVGFQTHTFIPYSPVPVNESILFIQVVAERNFLFFGVKYETDIDCTVKQLLKMLGARVGEKVIYRLEEFAEISIRRALGTFHKRHMFVRTVNQLPPLPRKMSQRLQQVFQRRV
jgi:hypothetical protein